MQARANEFLRQPFANRCIVGDIHSGQATVSVRREPHIRRHLMVTVVGFEGLLVRCPPEQQVSSPRPSTTVTENQIQAEGDALDEVVLIAFRTAIEVAEKIQPRTPVDDDPTGKVYRIDFCQLATIENMRRTEL